MDSENNNAYRNCFLCLFICVGLGIWFFLRMIHNRKKLNRNMELIGHQLKEMEDRIRQSIGQGDEESQLEEELNDSEMGITELLNQLKELEEEEMKRKMEQQEEFKSDDCEEEPAKDKKND